MFKGLSVITFLFLFFFSSCAQHDLKEYQGNWEGTLTDANIFSFNITLKALKANTYNLTIANYKTSINKKFVSSSDMRIQYSIDKNTHLDLAFNEDGTAINGFIKSGVLMYHISLKKGKDQLYTGTWNPFMIDRLQSQSIFLSVENEEDGSFATYPFFGDQRFTGTWAGNFTKENDIVSFRDFKTGFNFKATLLNDKIQLEILLAERTIAVSNLIRSDIDLFSLGSTLSQNPAIQEPEQLDDGWSTSNIQALEITPEPLDRMVDHINNKSLVNTHSVLIAKEGKLVFEGYFDGYHANLPHDQRSASKSISSAMIGIAIDDKVIGSAEQSVYDFLPKAYQYTKDPLKQKIRIKDLLTMSSGLDAIDFGIDRNSAASEDNYQNSNDWLKTVLEASMINEPGTHANYGSANPFLLGVSLSESLATSLELYMDQKLLAPLGITNYIIQTENTSTTPYFGGGMYLNPRDMLKFGQLFLNKGKWKGKQVISEDWVKDSFNKYLKLENANDKNEYGYLWWHKTYTIGDKPIESIEARGSGGQYIFVIPALESVVVITSGNFRNGKFQQPEKILEEYILPAMIK